LAWKEEQCSCLSLRPAEDFGGTEWSEKKGVRRGDYLATKLFCLMLVSDMTWSSFERTSLGRGWISSAIEKIFRGERNNKKHTPCIYFDVTFSCAVYT